MTEAQKIMNMIESVDPENLKGMDEIDVHVECYLNGWTFTQLHFDDFISHRIHGSEYTNYNYREYTRSRDALKQIRPYGYVYHSWTKDGVLFSAVLKKPYGSDKFPYESGRKEELAELHAIIQAIEYERSQK